MSIDNLKKQINEMSSYLGPRVGYTSDEWPEDKVDRWLIEYFFILQEIYYDTFREDKEQNSKNKKTDNWLVRLFFK